MESNVKTSLTDLTKLPAKQFEQHFQEWMERDEVAKTLQAKLRFDLIKSFNKTRLGKQMMIQNLYSNVNGSAYRVTLSPLILSLNTLVAEFLYASNCHYALSVFCTEVPFRNVLPDFERMKDFRFNDLEIKDLWEAVTSSSPYHKNLHRSVAKIYHAEYHNSLLLAVLKYLIKQRPDEMLKRTVEVQTDLNNNDNATQAISTQVSDSGDHVFSPLPIPRSDAKCKCKIHQDEGMTKFKKYIQILSHHVSVMIDKFDEFAELKKSFGKVEHSKSIRFRDYQSMGRSLERISKNIKHSAYAKRRNRKQQMLLRAIENMATEFNKCAEQFKDLQKDLRWKKGIFDKKLSTQDKQTETINAERSYGQWIFDMRNTANGKKFLQRVEASLNKAMEKHKEHVESEMKIRIKHTRSILKLRYKQKLLTCLSTQSFNDDNLEIHRLTENITKKLHEFELRQMEMLEKMQESVRNSRRLNENIENIEHPNLNATAETMIDQVNAIKKKIEKTYDSKLRLKELENESDRIERNFLNYLDRQKVEKIQIDQSQNPSNATHVLQIIQKFQHQANELTSKSKVLEDAEDDCYLVLKQHFQKTDDISLKLKPQESASSEELENAIMVAKEHFFEEKQRFRQNKRNELLEKAPAKIIIEGKLDEKCQTFYTNQKFDNHKSSSDLKNLEMYNQKHRNDGTEISKKDVNENCKIFEKISIAVATTNTTTNTTTTTTAIATTAAATTKAAQQKPTLDQVEKHEAILKKDNNTVKVTKPIKIGRDNMKKAFVTVAQDNLDGCLPKMGDVDIVKKTMNKIQKLFEENTSAMYKKNECENAFVEVEAKSSRILSNFTKSLEEHLLPNNKLIKDEETSTTSTDEENVCLEEGDKAQRISNISMPSFVDITSSTSSDNLESDVDIITARPIKLTNETVPAVQEQQQQRQKKTSMNNDQVVVEEMPELSENQKLNYEFNESSHSSSSDFQ